MLTHDDLTRHSNQLSLLGFDKVEPAFWDCMKRFVRTFTATGKERAASLKLVNDWARAWGF